MKRVLFPILALVLALGLTLPMATPVSAATDVYPGPGTPIQDAVDAASPGDTIIVHPGTYPEEVEIAKALTLQGIGWPTIEAPLGLNSNAIWIGASHVTVTGFELKAPDDIVDINPYHLPWTERIDNVVIEGNYVTPTAVVSDLNAPGIFACRVDNLTVRDNTISDTGGIGIFLGMTWGVEHYVNDSLIEGNLIDNPGCIGILAYATNSIEIKNNTISDVGPPGKPEDGIRLGWFAFDNTVQANLVSGSSGDGIRAVANASGNTIHHNTVTDNGGVGINVSGDSDSIHHNTVTANGGDGIKVAGDSDSIHHNTVTDSTGYGIHLTDTSHDNTVHHNTLSNNTTENIQDDGTNNKVFKNNVS